MGVDIISYTTLSPASADAVRADRLEYEENVVLPDDLRERVWAQEEQPLRVRNEPRLAGLRRDLPDRLYQGRRGESASLTYHSYSDLRARVRPLVAKNALEGLLEFDAEPAVFGPAAVRAVNAEFARFGAAIIAAAGDLADTVRKLIRIFRASVVVEFC